MLKKFIILALTTSIFVAIFFYRDEVDKLIQKMTGYSPIKFLTMKYVLLTDGAFVKRVNELAKMWSIPADWLIGCMYIESSLQASAINKFTQASGLIQFMPKTATGLGVTIEDIQGMNAVEQMELVEEYLEKYSNKWTQFIDVYLSIFYPAAIGQGDNFTIGAQINSAVAHSIAKVNPAYDMNKDGQITVAEIKTAVMSHLEKAGFNIEQL